MRIQQHMILITIITALSMTACATAQELRLTGPINSLAFTLMDDDTYMVSAGAAAKGAVNIPAYYRPGAESDFLPVTTIDGGAFGDCTAITRVTIPATVTEIGYGAFANCAGLARVTIPASVTAVWKHAFQYWTESQTIIIEGRADREEAVAAGWDEGWDSDCAAVIIYGK